MSGSAFKIVDPTGQPFQPGTGSITDVAALPSVWDLNGSIEGLVDGTIPRASVNLISGESGIGKSWLTYGIAGAVARGKEFIGRTVHQSPVLYLDGENPLYVVKRNLSDLGIERTDQLLVWGGWNEPSAPGPSDHRITSFAKATKPLLIWDSLVEFAGCDEQSANEMREFMKGFRRLADLGATVIVLHHTGKSKTSKEYRGSSDIKASVDMAYVVTGHPRYGKLHRLEMDPFKSRIAPGERFAMEFRAGHGFTAINVPKSSTAMDQDDIVRTIVRENPKSNGSQIKKLAKERGVGKNLVDEILANGEYAIESGRGSAKLYTVREDQVSDFPNPRVREVGESDGDPG